MQAKHDGSIYTTSIDINRLRWWSAEEIFRKKNLFFKNIIYLVVNYYYASISLEARLCFLYNVWCDIPLETLTLNSGIQLRTNNTRNNQVCPFHNQKCHSYSSNTTTHSKQVNKLLFRQSAMFCHNDYAIKNDWSDTIILTFKYRVLIIKSLVANFSLSFLHTALYSPSL